MDAIPTTDPFDTFTKTLCVGNDNVTLTLYSLVGSLGIVAAPIINLSGRLVKPFLHLVQSPFGLWTRWRKGLTSLPDRLMMGAATMPKLPTKEYKVRVTLSFPTHKVFVKVSKGSVVGMASKLTSRVALPSKTYWSPPRTKTLWSTKAVPYIGTNVVT